MDFPADRKTVSLSGLSEDFVNMIRVCAALEGESMCSFAERVFTPFMRNYMRTRVAALSGGNWQIKSKRRAKAKAIADSPGFLR
jgi:hypothetical protein